MHLKPGLKLRSAASTAQLIVIKAPAADVELTCAGAAVTAEDPGTPQPADGPALLVGKRYVDPDGTVELLCAAPGSGPLVLDGTPLSEQAAKALPSSD